MMKNFRKIAALVVIALLSLSAAQAQEQSRYSGHRLGVHGAVNYNLSGLGYQNISPNNDVDFVPFVVEDGDGFGPYAGISYEYLSKDWWGLQFRLSYDSRDLTNVIERQSGRDDLYDFNVDYITFEPLFRADQNLIPNLHFVGGPLVAFNILSRMDYSGGGQAGPNAFEDVEIPNMREVTWGLTGGMGYDFFMDEPEDGHRWVLTPFADFSWMVDQRPRTEAVAQDRVNDVWSTSTIRLGLKLSSEWLDIPEVAVAAEEQTVNLTLNTPAGGTIRQRMIEDYFTLIPYVFFDQGNTNIPARYALLDRAGADAFSEQDLLNTTELKNLPDNKYPEHQMRVYYNLMNIYGERMQNNSGVTLTLTGSDPSAPANGIIYANNVKDYLVNNFGIDPARIITASASIPPVNPSGDEDTPKEDLDLAREENRRVTFQFSNDNMNMPLALRMVESNTIDNDLVLNVDTRNIQSWTVDIVGNEKSMTYGPFYYDQQRINASNLLDNLDQGTYTANVKVTTTDGKTITTERRFNLVREVYNEGTEIGRRHSITFEFDEADAIEPYEEWLSSGLAPQIPEGNRIIVHGHTDVIGLPERNMTLSTDRAEQTRNILKSAFSSAGKNIQIDAYGFGETREIYPNNLPEGRQYNRNIIIEVVPVQ